MREEFNNNAGYSCIFDDEKIICNDSVNQLIFNYGSIMKIGYFLGTMTITGTNSYGYFVFCPMGRDKTRLKQAIEYARQKNSSSTPSKAIVIPLSKIEHKMRCNTCGNIFCYNEKDIADNKSNIEDAKTATTLSMLNAAAGTQRAMYEESKKAEIAKSKIVEFDRCPKCKSTNISEISEEEWNNYQNNDDAGQSQTLSSADELKKFKELLDSGIITQEEFNTKKKQLLGL